MSLLVILKPLTILNLLANMLKLVVNVLLGLPEELFSWVAKWKYLVKID